MTTTMLTKNARTLVAVGTSNAAGSTTRGTLDMRTAHGGLLTLKITNGATGPTVQCVCNVLCAHDSGSTPSAGSAGAVWKTLWSFGGGLTGSITAEQSMVIDPGVMHLEVEFKGNTGQAVTVEALLSEITSAVSA